MKCDKCKAESYEVKEMRLMGGYRASLCPLCLTVFGDTHLEMLDVGCELSARIEAAIQAGNGELAAEIARKMLKEKIRLYWISKKWVIGGEMK